MHGAGTYVAPSLNHAGYVITTSGVFSLKVEAASWLEGSAFSRI
jgi:hypothetical protein